MIWIQRTILLLGFLLSLFIIWLGIASNDITASILGVVFVWICLIAEIGLELSEV